MPFQSPKNGCIFSLLTHQHPSCAFNSSPHHHHYLSQSSYMLSHYVYHVTARSHQPAQSDVTARNASIRMTYGAANPPIAFQNIMAVHPHYVTKHTLKKMTEEEEISRNTKTSVHTLHKITLLCKHSRSWTAKWMDKGEKGIKINKQRK